jgi:hypothetical protein
VVEITESLCFFAPHKPKFLLFSAHVDHTMTTAAERIPTTVLQHLEQLGSASAEQNVETILDALRSFVWINRLNWRNWYPAITGHSRDRLKNIIRGLVRAEQLPG